MGNEYSRLKELQDICKNKMNQVNDLYNDVANPILKKDIKLLIEKHNGIKLIKPNYYKSSSFEYRINKNNLEVIDNRNESFLWRFEVILNVKLRLGDAFSIDKKPYSVNYIHQVDNENILSNVEKVIKEFEDSIQFLKENRDFKEYKYYYECEHENVKCSDIFEVYNTIINRE
ncbi:hypothetical protein ACFHWD_16270 [Clostridium sp. MT-14]|uniref:hypothetical protein n=1 Tax=Clostridium sp. MT-14 TaxID=3348360 RepID=UPI0035F3F23E